MNVVLSLNADANGKPFEDVRAPQGSSHRLRGRRSKNEDNLVKLSATPRSTTLGTVAPTLLAALIAIMKITIDIPDQELSDAMRFTGAKTARKAVLSAVTDFNRRRLLAELADFAGTCPDMMTVDELLNQRRRQVGSAGASRPIGSPGIAED